LALQVAVCILSLFLEERFLEQISHTYWLSTPHDLEFFKCVASVYLFENVLSQCSQFIYYNIFLLFRKKIFRAIVKKYKFIINLYLLIRYPENKVFHLVIKNQGC
jgi:hypothetical protein